MIETATAWVAAAIGGGLLALGSLAGLWWTVRRLPASPRPAWLVTGSFLARAVVVSAALVAGSGGDAAALLIAVAAFLVVRHRLVAEARVRLRSTRVVEG